MKTLKLAGHPASRLKSVLESVTFCRYSFDIPDLHELTVSKRCLGAVVDGVQGKVQQAAPLTVSDVECLHWHLEHGELWNKVFSGAALFCIYSRARWSDFIHGNCIRLDANLDGTVAYADMEVQIHKTMRASANRFKFMDLVVSGIGMAGHNWIEQWMAALHSIGIDPLEGKIGHSLMPAPGDDGSALQRSLESDEASVWLRLLLGEKASKKDSERKISSHSMKATLLSMAAKRGLTPEDRLAMGHHIHPFRMADVYAGTHKLGATAGQLSLLRRLHFEAATFVLSQLKSAVSSDATDGVKKLPYAEKMARYTKVKETIKGFLIQGETEPSHSLVDKCQVMFDTNAVVWLAPSVCTKRDLEVWAAPKDSQQMLKIESQTLKVSAEGPQLGDADHGSEIKLQWCWQRRGVAVEMCEVLSWTVSQTWLSMMFSVYSTDPPPGFARVTLQQLIAADKTLWTILAREAEMVKPDATGKRPLDEAVEKLMTDPRVTMHMLSLPHKSPASSSVAEKPSSSSAGAPPTIRPKKKARPGKRNRPAVAPPEELKSSDILETRSAFFNKWIARAKVLSEDEENLQSELSKHVGLVLSGKRLLLLKEILESLDYPDKYLFTDIIAGFRLSGWRRDFQVFMSLPRPPKMSMDALLKSSQGLQHAVLRRVAEPEDAELHRAVWEETMQELEKNWIWEDSSGDISEKIIAHRFGLRQGEKVRVIDNFKQCGLNDACGLPEKFVLHGVDYVAATLIRALALGGNRNGSRLLGKTFDLKAAYEQYPLRDLDREQLRIAIRDPDSRATRLFGLNALPFGATGSVAGFLRISSALFYIMTEGLKVWASAFFDDFPTLSLSDLANNTEQCVGMLLDLLGIQFARDGKKCQAFGDEMKALGLIFDFSEFGQGRVFIKHTPDRRLELLDKIVDILETDALSPKDAESFRGRIQWYESYLFGRIANLAIHRVGKRALAKNSTRHLKLDAELRASLEFLKDRVDRGTPLELNAHTEQTLLVFTDGAYNAEDLTGTVGGILLDHQGNPMEYFSERVPALLMKHLLKEADNPTT
eukprot:s2858_g8.t1